MAMITLSLNGKVLGEFTLARERMAIGRGPGNDLVLDNLAVSAEHAVVVAAGNDFVLEDINSTNGTQVNGQPIKMHFLQDGDVIEIAQYRIRYLAEPEEKMPLPGATDAKLIVVDGPCAGKEVVLTKALTTIGRPGVQVAGIARREQGYYLMHVEGNMPPSVNSKAVGSAAYELIHGDVIDISGTRMRFAISTD